MTHSGPCVLSCSFQGVRALKGQFSFYLETSEIDSSQSVLLMRGARTAFVCIVKDFGHKLSSISTVKQPKITARSGAQGPVILAKTQS